MKLYYRSLGLVALAGLLASCASLDPLQPGAEKVIVTTKSAVKSCRYVGDVFSQDKNGFDNAYTSHENLQNMELNRIRNKAVTLGANYVVLPEHQTTYKRLGRGSVSLINIHRLAGKAYVCPSSVLSQSLNEPIPETTVKTNLQ